MNRDEYRDQIVTCDVGVSLNSKHCSAMAQAHSVMHITIRACFLCSFYNLQFLYILVLFYNSYMSLLNFSYILLSPVCLLYLNRLILYSNDIESPVTNNKNIREHISPFPEYPSQQILSLWYTRWERYTGTFEYRVL